MTIDQIDLTDLDVFTARRFHEQLGWLRDNDPVHWHATPGGGGFWILTCYEDITAAYRDHQTLSSSGGAMLGGSFRNESDTSSGRMPVSSDPPRHRMLRQVMHRVFTPKMIAQAAEQISVLVAGALFRAESEGGADFSTDIATELPAGALMILMGMSYADAHWLIGMTRRMIGYRDPLLVDMTVDEPLRLAGIQADILEFFADLLLDRSDADGDDLISVLRRSEINGQPLSFDDILYNCLNFAVGGNETSSYTACAGLLELMREPEQRQRLTADPDLLDSGLNEMLRWSSTNAYVQRRAVTDMELHGRTIRAGEAVTLWNVSANFDERQFADPYRFRLDRSPNRHLSYGSAIHRCIGAALAHSELTVLFRQMLDRRWHFEPAGDVRYLRSNFILGITRLPVAVVGD
ncbi:cytochrome P450 [Micromonospora sp. DT53]|uniref:cytochrome P450 n=1 Tax=Micromonospora sp. DT53 TaxID=3393444 RepID=UPI003CED7F44